MEAVVCATTAELKPRNPAIAQAANPMFNPGRLIVHLVKMRSPLRAHAPATGISGLEPLRDFERPDATERVVIAEVDCGRAAEDDRGLFVGDILDVQGDPNAFETGD